LNKPYAESCEQNREPILSVIQPLLARSKAVLEIGSGTGQHAVYFAQGMPQLVWHTSDQAEHHPGIHCWLEEADLENTQLPLELDVSQPVWPEMVIDSVFTANTLHIMSWQHVEKLFAGVGRILPNNGQLLIYGPFNYNNNYTSNSNREFDGWLKSRDPLSGIRNFEDVNALAEQAGMRLMNDYAMPANNRILYWEKINKNQ